MRTRPFLPLLKNGSLPSDAIFICIQEAKITKAELDNTADEARMHGWELLANPCIGTGNNKSGGVALIVKSGDKAVRILDEDIGTSVPQGPRLGFWLVDVGCKGGILVVAVHLYDTIGLDSTNFAILNKAARVIAAVAKPFVIMSDWNV